MQTVRVGIKPNMVFKDRARGQKHEIRISSVNITCSGAFACNWVNSVDVKYRVKVGKMAGTHDLGIVTQQLLESQFLW